MKIEDAIKALDEVRGGLLFDEDNTEMENTEIAMQHYLLALADLERVVCNLKLAVHFHTKGW